MPKPSTLQVTDEDPNRNAPFTNLIKFGTQCIRYHKTAYRFLMFVLCAKEEGHVLNVVRGLRTLPTSLCARYIQATHNDEFLNVETPLKQNDGVLDDGVPGAGVPGGGVPDGGVPEGTHFMEGKNEGVPEAIRIETAENEALLEKDRRIEELQRKLYEQEQKEALSRAKKAAASQKRRLSSVEKKQTKTSNRKQTQTRNRWTTRRK